MVFGGAPPSNDTGMRHPCSLAGWVQPTFRFDADNAQYL